MNNTVLVVTASSAAGQVVAKFEFRFEPVRAAI